MVSFTENQGSRVFHLMMIVPAGLLLLLLSLISLGTIAGVNRDFLDKYEDREPNGDATCVLYAENDNNGIEFQDGDSCTFAAAGAGILAALAVAYTVVLVVKAIIGVNVVSLTALIELGMSAAGALWALIVASVITAGLNDTCQAYRDSSNNYDNLPCCFFYYPFVELIKTDNPPDVVFFYEGINTSRITAWIAMFLLIVLAGVYTFILIRYFCGGCGIKQASSAPPAKTNPI